MCEKKISIRNENKEDFRIVEELTREAFWNLYQMGADEHYLTHIIRDSEDFIKELDFVALIDNKIIGNIIYSKSYILNQDNIKFPTITFGPLAVLPSHQNIGVGSLLLKHSISVAKDKGYKCISIYGNPDYYKKFGFKHGKCFNISNPDGLYPKAHLILELEEGCLNNISGKAFESDIFNMNENDILEFDKTFSHKEKFSTQTQKKFLEIANSFL